MVEISHSPCTPDVTPFDYFLFLKMKLILKCKRFQDISNVTAEVNAVPVNAFDDCFVKLLEILEKCVTVKRDY